ncbi:hypothetical protein GUITHDRAFT_108930 [Guillardia theta CCMP2712]|uniref:Uncharacterized protein n=1 Tax=Guillardia theta (strain CCMP2712) TaxID=905079 RepID=L1J9T3_GUITC|nr:hypothetical protein GUITHDRAFT_108930 [Guillardia theta CCMP2712]EKX45288.1 hypothetical protein GUITHDRAFT_108930 [Guillardia theta CCMP2712]|eukprot:XP_005832268.1 hypothetical protein GUITHDRAFT_108930 [Guillardia theta CCMP2712]
MENKTLRSKLEKMEREYKELKRAYFELSIKQRSSNHMVGSQDSLTISDGIDTSEGIQDQLQEEVHNKPVQRKEEGKSFSCKCDLEGHAGAVYVARFCHKGQYIASGSLDKSVRIWTVQSDSAGRLQGEEKSILQEHNLNVSDVSWTSDDLFLVSGAYDRSVKYWDLQACKSVSSYELCGFVLCCVCHPLDCNQIWAGTSQNQACLIDKRSSTFASVLQNDGMMNGLCFTPDCNKLFSGDSKGCIKAWDLRMMNESACDSVAFHIESNKPISDLHFATLSQSQEISLLAANSYDNILRVFSRANVGSHERDQMPGSRESLRMIHSLQGHKNKNFPIRSSFFRGKLYNYANVSICTSTQQLASSTSRSTTLDKSLLVATGSVDKYCYVYDISNPSFGEFFQKLEGHADRVYCASFHHEKPLIVTASADSKMKIWGPRER